MKIMIAIPCMDTVPVMFVESMMRMVRPEGTAVCFQKSSLIYDSRNLLSLHAIREGYDYVFWMDSDMVCPPETIPQLLNDMKEHNVGMVTGLYVTRKAPTLPVIYTEVQQPIRLEDGTIEKQIDEYMNYPKDSVFPVGGCGFGCVLTSVPLLKKVWDNHYPAFTPYSWAGEDLTFCHKVGLLGETILCDSRVKCGHIGNFIYTESLLHGGGDK